MKIGPLNRTLGGIWAFLLVSAFAIVIMKIPHARIWIAIVILVASGMAILTLYHYPRIAKLKRFEGRESLSDEQIFQRFYSTSTISKAAILEEWHRVSSLLAIPSGLLRPADRFDVELSPVQECSHFDDGLRELIGRTGRRLAIPDDQVVVKIKTLDDYIRNATKA